MKLKKTNILILIFIFGCFLISGASAQDTDNLNSTSIETQDISDNNLLTVNESEEIISDDCCDEPANEINASKTWHVNPDPNNPNQVQAPTVQPAIDNAKPGDTIVLNGTFVHCHFMINKTLTIIATPGTSVGVCPHHTHMMKYGTGPADNGIFYISPEANGTVLSGFSFTNDFYYIANNVYNPFGVYVDGNNVTLENLTFNWVGAENKASNYNPQDFLFNAIILNNVQNISINNIILNNINSFLISNNSSNINTENITIERVIKEIMPTNIIVSDLKIQIGENGNLKVNLKDKDNNPIANKNITIIINGISESSNTDSNGTAKLTVKYDVAGTYYAIASFMGDDDYKASINAAKITVNKKPSSLKVSKVTLKVKKAKKIKITLTSNGNTVAGKKITIKVNKKTFSAKTNSKGIAYIKVKLTKSGTYKYSANFAGDKIYKSVSKSSKIVVKK